jgi:4-amino-4-deoxy-L-arabinose transferase-like glycosyltransferase
MLKKPQNNNGTLLAFILGLALILRLLAINHSFPYILHPDEPAVVRAALGLRFDLNPHHFDWPHLFLYLNFIVYKGFAFMRDLFASLGWKAAFSQVLPIIWDDNLVFYLISRIFAALLGAFTIFPVYLTGKKLFNQKAGLFAALAFAIIPFHVHATHYALIDVPMTFFMAWAVYFCSRIYKENSLKDYLLAGLFVGFAASTKYHGALAAVAVPLAYLFYYANHPGEWVITIKGIGKLLTAAIMSILGFLIGTPFALLDYKTFIRTDGPAGALWQFKNVSSVDFPQQINQFIDTLFVTMTKDYGFTLLILYIVVSLFFIYLLIRKRKPEQSAFWLIFIPSILIFFYISGFEKNRTHYYMGTTFFVALLSGYFLELILEKIRHFRKLLVIVVFLVPIYFSLADDIKLMQRPKIESDTKIYGGKYERR